MAVPLSSDQIARLEAEGAWPQALAELMLLMRSGAEMDAGLLHWLGRIHQRLAASEQARRAYLRALALDPQRPSTYNNLALLELARLDGAQAEFWLQEGLRQPALTDDEAELLNASACELYLYLLKPKRALEHVQRQLERRVSVMALANRAICHHRLGQLEQALADQYQALNLFLSQVAPDWRLFPVADLVGRRLADLQQSCQLQLILLNLGIYRLLLQPDDRQGLDLLMASTFSDVADWLDLGRCASRWCGQPVRDLLVWEDQGFGDSIQNLAWLPDAAARCQKLRLWLRPQLMALVEERLHLPANVSVEPMPEQADPWGEGIPQLGLFFLPMLLKQWPSLDSPARPPWLRRRQVIRGASPSRRVGLVWSAGRHRAPQPERSARVRDVPFDQLWTHALRWRQLHGLELISLQLEGHDHPAVAAQMGAGLLQPGLQSADWLATAQCLDGLDLVVSVDTSVAHLAGAMGIPCVLLLGVPADWRWGQQGAFTPLYGSMRLARCSHLDGWGSAMEQADQQIEEILT
ncbi:tetratricopeptide repeat protein [Cyanobium sp. WAJ14-Wanaka]|uniref:tetratricopeptide repeat protein n=1 Tax=Cyanobium sp. WAJ14-Wanaka TaxID=2823725 RepID=UPI0020CC0644|nr:tetratricopeptide repeat-containing glycosyltransferase family protein [Cyanobium sp. WAJ14-Wanaka]MCP9775652.1 glycosyltransferase family protein [Cyanobium sp. WAJ14-Wanaka]